MISPQTPATRGPLGLDRAQDIAAAVASGAISPVEVVQAALDAMDRLDPSLNAFCTPAHDEALAVARRLEARIRAGEAAGPLAGVPVAIKDLIFTRGLRTTFGSRLYADFVPDEDDVAVARLRVADAIIVGKTNAAEFGYGGFGHNPLFPTTRNPWDPALTSGGSSAGSAAAVAAGLCPIALGSDGGGSVRLPAAFCGIVGFKPTMGRIPLWPGCRDPRFAGASGWESIEHYGVLSRGVDDAALMFDVMAGPDPRDRLSLPRVAETWRTIDALPRGLRIAFVPTWSGEPLDRAVATLAERAAARFSADLGADVEAVTAPFDDCIHAYRAIVAMETDLTGLRARIAAAAAGVAVSRPLSALLAAEWSGDRFADAIVARKQAVAAIACFMERFDLVLTPTVPTTAFPIDRDGPGSIDGQPIDDDAWTPALFPLNLTGQPAASVPAGWTGEGLPVGLQIVGRRFDDSLVLAAARAFETVQPWHRRYPPISIWSEDR
ncbi:amidase [Mesorhizobium sp. BR1-1-16]|uniref:amidase n=1 Tax=Mesorhizobium sp. BR1-1-16 TaxID=2876653 RepID=UPI001CC973A4|nr:amidase family protein [Mesorhizobium sp. BR1-1-16]MBZ9939418.1 amidase [Mesorhizobium sp. BR1-1-16]